MQKFYTNEQNKIQEVVQQLNTTLQKFNARDYNAVNYAFVTVTAAIEMYKNLGLGIKESAVQIMLAELTTAQRGINTQTYQKQVTGKNELLNSTTYKVLTDLQHQLQTCFYENAQKLGQAKELLVQIVTAALQSQFITQQQITAANTTDKVEALWKAINKDANIALGAQRVLLLVSKYDCLLIFSDLLDGLK
jgi:hypothetical protein